MMKKLLFAWLMLMFCPVAKVLPQEPPLTDHQKILGLSRLWEGVRNNFVYYDQLTFDWDSLYAASLETICGFEDDYEYMRELKRLAASLGDGHTYVRYADTPPHEKRITPAPFTTRYVEGKVLVDKVWSSALAAAGVRKGTQVVSVDGLAVMEYVDEFLRPYVATSTPQWLYYQTLNNYELTKGYRDRPITVGFRNAKKEFTVAIDRDGDWDLQEDSDNGSNDDLPALEYSEPGNNIGLLKVRNFMDREFYPRFDSLYTRILTSDALVFDLRDNGGGNSFQADYVLRHLSAKPIKSNPWSSRMYIAAHASWGYPQEWYMMGPETLDPVAGKEPYEKPVVVLVNEGTFSSAEDFCMKFRGMDRGKIIGVPTGGSTGNGVRIFLLPDRAFVNICSKKDMGADGTEFVGVGVIPDLEAAQTVESFMTGFDYVLATGIQELLK